MSNQYRARIEQVMKLRCPARKDKHGNTFPWVYIDHRETEHSFDIAFRVPCGYSAHDLIQETDAIFAACGAHISIQDRGGAVVVSISRKDFPDIIPYSPDLLTYAKGRQVLCGFDLLGRPVIHDFRVPHVLIGAQSGYGKTDLLRWWIFQLIHRFTPEQLHIDIIDGKGFSFLPFRGIPHIRRIVRDLAGAAAIMEEGKRVMNERSDMVWESSDRNLTNAFQWRMIIVDELYVISPSSQVTKANKEIALNTYANMCAIACVGREAGLGMIMATQRPDRDVVHPQVKQNCDVSIAMRCKTETNSEIILDHGGAEKLPHGKAGRAIYGGTTDTIFQIPYIGKDDKWDELLKPYRREAPAPEQADFIDDLSDYE